MLPGRKFADLLLEFSRELIDSRRGTGGVNDLVGVVMRSGSEDVEDAGEIEGGVVGLGGEGGLSGLFGVVVGVIDVCCLR